MEREAGEARATTTRDAATAPNQESGRQVSGANYPKITPALVETEIKNIYQGLKDEGKAGDRWLTALVELGERVARTARAEAAQPSRVEARLTSIEDLVRNLCTQQGIGKGLQGQRSWATVAAASVGPAGAAQAQKPRSLTVRAAVHNAKELTPEQILTEVKRSLPEAAAVRVLHSGDVDIVVPNEAALNRAQAIAPSEGLKIYKKDYLIEVAGVPLTTEVKYGKQADNSDLARSIETATRQLAPGLQISRIQWLYDQRKLASIRAAGKTRGSLIVGLLTEEMRRKAITSGVVIGAQLYEVRLFEPSLRASQCYKCQQWGHVSHTCGRTERCGRCAGAHKSEKCDKSTVSCANCGKPHPAWNRRACPAYQTYQDALQGRRVAARLEAYRMREARAPQEYQSEAGPNQWQTVGRKRQRPSSLRPRRVGRPTHLSQAANDPAQMQLFNFTVSASQEVSMVTDEES
jgi:hypothetical protein